MPHARICNSSGSLGHVSTMISATLTRRAPWSVFVLTRPKRAARMADFAGLAIVLSVVAATIGCDDPSEPLPQPYPPNIGISVDPAPGSTVDPAAAERVVIHFDRPMDPASMRIVRRMSFLLPLSVTDLDGTWNNDRTRVMFELTQYPVQPGASYEAVFSGLRMAGGELYNLGPYRIHFRTRGIPDLLPVNLDSVLESMTFCHDLEPDGSDCTTHSTLRTVFAGRDSIWYRWNDDGGQETGELFRRRPRALEWLGLDTGVGDAWRRVLWSEPLPLCNLPAVRGSRMTAAARTSADGSRLDLWECVVASPESPTHTIRVSGLAVQLAFNDATVLDIGYDLTSPGKPTERHRERWWLYPGVGLVRREIRVQRGDTVSFERRRFAPGLPNETSLHRDWMR